MNFIKSVLSTVVAIWLAVLIIVLITVGLLVSFSKDIVKEIQPESVLEINMGGEMSDYLPSKIDPLTEVFNFDEKKVGFNNVCKALEVATFDENIKGISLRAIPANLGWAQATELRKLLQKFKDKGKFIYAFDDVYSQKKYYLNSVADSLFVSPLGRIELKGLHSEVLFYKSLQEKLGVKMEVIRHGKYKSAVEPFIADEMSTSNRTQIKELIDGLWKNIQVAISESRNVNVEKAVMELHGASSSKALEHHLIDGVLYQDTYYQKLKKRLAVKKLAKISLSDYINNKVLLHLSSEVSKIAVVYAQGQIMYGEGELNIIGQKKMIKALNNAVENKEVKAIVFRINSPGGSALASDLIWRAVENAKSKKPVIVSMGNLAASGGYYIACNANRIFAEPTTITGSIGVFGMLPNAAKLAKEIGINAEVVSTHNNGMYYSAVLPVDNRFKKAVKSGIESVYDTFLERVSKGRNLSIKEVDAVAQGRVWTGTKALEIGLVDELGGLGSAIAYAAKKVSLDTYSIKEYPEYKLDFKSMFSVESLIKLNLLKSKLISKEGLDKVDVLNNIITQKGVQAAMPFELNID